MIFVMFDRNLPSPVSIVVHHDFELLESNSLLSI